MRESYVLGYLDTVAGKIPRVATAWTVADRWGEVRVRCSQARNDYKVEPGIYAVGSPGKNTPVFVSANYKLSFDKLRCELDGLDGWIIVLDTKGINVWCAAGKGTFGTEEIINRVNATRLAELVEHRELILPQLGAPGVAAHAVQQATGFKVKYGPVYAKDIPVYLAAGRKATPALRRVHFTLSDRLILVPMEVYLALGKIVMLGIVMALLSLLRFGVVPLDAIGRDLLYLFVNLLGGLAAGAVIGPLLLPWLPGRAFSFKGFEAGLLVFLVLLYAGTVGETRLEQGAWLLLVCAIASFATMNFTGASTYTSLSGVRKEMKVAVPLQALAAAVGFIIWAVTRFM